MADFLDWSDGATLFDATVAIYGFVEYPSRSLDLQDQTALSLSFENEIFAAVSPERWGAVWMRIGSLVGWSTRLVLEAHESGQCAISCENGPSKEHRDFLQMLETVVGRVGSCFTCSGVIDVSYRELEAALVSLIQVN